MPKAKYDKYIGPERRKYLRIPNRCAIKYTKLSNKLRPLANLIIKSYMKDISAAGMKFVVRKKMPVHTIVEFQFRLPDIAGSIDGLGEVVRIRPKDGGRSYSVGMKFIWIQQRNVDLIDNYVRKKMIQQVVTKLRKK